MDSCKFIGYFLIVLLLAGVSGVAFAEGGDEADAVQGDAKAVLQPDVKVEAAEDAGKPVEDLSRTPLGEVGAWDAAECSACSAKVDARLVELGKEMQRTTLEEAEMKNRARSGGKLPPEYQKLVDEIAGLRKEMERRTKELSVYLDGMESVQEIRKKSKDLADEWRRLQILKDAAKRQTKVLESKKEAGATVTR